MIVQGDCLDVMGHIPDGKIDLIYADPPYNTGRDFGEFDDRWDSDKAYLSYMAARFREMHRVLASTGSLYLHCDPTMSHYLKVELDKVFGRANFRNEIIWSYRRWASVRSNFQKMHDVVFRYSMSRDDWVWNQLYEPLAPSTVKQWGTTRQKSVFDESGKRVRSSRSSEESKGVAMRDVWDISVIAPRARERTGYPTQKPLRLLDRIIKASSNEGDVVFDPFCGSGTTLVSAHKLGRRYIGCDISDEAIRVAKKRLAGV